MAEWATAYLDFAKTKFCFKTYEEKTGVFKRFFNFVKPELLVDDLNRRLMLDYIINQKETRSGYAANKDRKNLMAAWNWGIKYLGLSEKNPCMVDRMAETRQPRYVPPEADFWAVYNVCDEINKSLLLAFLYTAARRGELQKLLWSDIDFNNGTIRLATKKRLDGTMEYDVLPTVGVLLDEFKNLYGQSASFSVFADSALKNLASMNRFMARACKKAGVKPFGFHAIRHLTATTLYHKGCDVATIQAILRHKSPSTTERYLKTLGLEKIKKALDKLTSVVEFDSSRKSIYTQVYTQPKVNMSKTR